MQASSIAHLAPKLTRSPVSALTTYEPCTCVPLGGAVEGPPKKSAAYLDECTEEQYVPVSSELNRRIWALTQQFLANKESLSILIVHMTQLETSSLAPQAQRLYQRQQYHAALHLLQQVLVNIRRVIRIDDKMILQESSGAAFVFPQVDQSGIQAILERAYSSICLLQAETMLPPLTRETSIVLGIGTYAEPDATLEHLYRQAGSVAHEFTLRPAITAHLYDAPPHSLVEIVPMHINHQRSDMAEHLKKSRESKEPVIPYMELPRALPTRLTQLIPYQIACDLHCAPVGREHQYLTVAMSEPTDQVAIKHLHEITGLTIFPVACEENELNNILHARW